MERRSRKVEDVFAVCLDRRGPQRKNRVDAVLAEDLGALRNHQLERGDKLGVHNKQDAAGGLAVQDCNKLCARIDGSVLFSGHVLRDRH